MLGIVGQPDGLGNRHRDPRLLPHVDQGTDVLGKTASAKSHPGEQKGIADAAVAADTGPNAFNIRTVGIA